MKQAWLFNPGPVNTSATVKQAAIAFDLCHREPEVAALTQDVRAALLRIAGLEGSGYETALVMGSGTSALELGVINTVREGKKLLVLNNGVYGERIRKIAELQRIDTVEVKADWREQVDLTFVEQLLRTDAEIDAVALVHHETTTGLINDVAAVGRLCKQYKRLFFLDSVSGFGGEELDILGSNVDVMAATSNKCLHGLPGISFVLVSPFAQQALERIPARSLYFDLKNYVAQQKKGETPFTTNNTALLALSQAIKELEAQGGIEARIAAYKKRSAYLRSELSAAGLEFYIDGRYFSNSITTFKLPQGLSYPHMHDVLKEKGFVIYAGQGKLASEIFRIANLGEVPFEIYAQLVDNIKALLPKKT